MAQSWTVLQVLDWTADYLRDRGIESGRRDAEVLLGDVLGLDRVGIYLNFDRPLVAEELGAFRERVKRRARREPIQYIRGETEFWSLSLRVDPAVLIPRADTEILVEEALSRAGQGPVLDVGTGSGAVALALARELPGLDVIGLDNCEEALARAAENARRNDLQTRVRLIRGDLADLPPGRYALIAANPPYVPDAELDELMPEVRDFEPRSALAGGADGLDAYRALARQVPQRLSPGGWLLVEVGIGQAEAVRDLMRQGGLTETFIRDDYAGIPRVVGGRLA